MVCWVSRKPEEIWIVRISSQNFNPPTALVRMIIHLEGVVWFSKIKRIAPRHLPTIQNHFPGTLNWKVRRNRISKILTEVGRIWTTDPGRSKSKPHHFFCYRNSSACAPLLQPNTDVWKGTIIKMVVPIYRGKGLPTSFTLREGHCCSSSELLCVSSWNHKDGTRTIEMILVSTVLKGVENESLLVFSYGNLSCGVHHKFS